jgi:hypothetical protein
VCGRHAKKHETKGEQDGKEPDFPHSDRAVYDRHPINGRASG